MKTKIEAEDIVKGALLWGNGLVEIILGEGYDFSVEHPIEKYLKRAGINYSIKIQGGSDRNYAIDLTKIDVFYSDKN